MRLVELHLDADRPVDLQLHHRLTVVAADEAAGRRIVELLARAYVLAGTEVTGTVDGGGFMTPFDPTAVVALDLVGDGLRTLTPADLPAPDPTRREAARAAAIAAVEACRPAVEAARVEVDRHRRRHDATAAAITAGREELTVARERLADIDASLLALDARPPELAREREAAVAAVDAARSRIEELRTVRDQVAAALGATGDASHLRIGADPAAGTDALRGPLERAGALGGLPASQLDEALAWLAALDDGSAEVHPAAQQLLDESAEIEERWARAAAAGVEGDPTVLAALAQRDALASQRELLDGLSRSGLLGDTARSEIEAAHAGVAAAKGAAQEAAVAAEDEALARYGFDSHLDFTIATSTRTVGQKAQAKLASVTQELADAETALAAAREQAAADLTRLAEQREPMRERISEYLGERPEGPAAPYLQAIPAVPDAVLRAVDALDDSIEVAQDEVVRYTDAVTDLDDEASSLDAHRVELEGNRLQVDGRIVELESVLDLAEHELEAAAARSAAASATAAGSEADLAAALRTVEELEDTTEASYTEQDLPTIVEALVTALDPWNPRSHPVLLHDTYAPLGTDAAIRVLSEAVARAERSQLVYVTADPALAEWAGDLDPVVGTRLTVGRSRWRHRLGRRRSRT